jgi:hypothetical protein
MDGNSTFEELPSAMRPVDSGKRYRVRRDLQRFDLAAVNNTALREYAKPQPLSGR